MQGNKEEDKTRVVHYRKEKYDVYIGRPGKWGNPFTHLKTKTQAEFQVATRQESIDKYREYLLSNKELMAELCTLKGKTLGCWCKPKSCHGDVIVDVIEKYCKDQKL